MRHIFCNFCNNNKTELLYIVKDRQVRQNSDRKFYLHQCKKCGLAYLNPQPDWSELKYFYGGNYYTNNPDQQNQCGNFYDFLRKIKRKFSRPPNLKFWDFGKNKGRFLNIGCGNAIYESHIIKSHPGWEFYCVEPSHLPALAAKKITRLEVFEGFLEESRYQDNFFDVILMNNVLEHCPDPSSIISECYKILKPGGRLVIDVPNFNSPIRRLFGTFWAHLDAPRHLFHFSSDILSKILRKAGFKIESIKFGAVRGAIIYCLAYKFSLQNFLKRPLISLSVRYFSYLFFPINKIIVEKLHLAGSLKIVARKPE